MHFLRGCLHFGGCSGLVFVVVVGVGFLVSCSCWWTGSYCAFVCPVWYSWKGSFFWVGSWIFVCFLCPCSLFRAFFVLGFLFVSSGLVFWVLVLCVLLVGFYFVMGFFVCSWWMACSVMTFSFVVIFSCSLWWGFCF